MSATRAVCYRCFKPEITCICGQLPLVQNRTPVIVMQHPREHLHPIGTARFARLGLAQSAVHVAWRASAVETEAPAWLPPGTGLLYPSPDARELDQLPVSEHPRQLLVLDGTWHTAKTLYRQKQWLHDLPHYRLSPVEPGRYRIRREPQHDYLSTIEAIVSALQILEPETKEVVDLIRAFDAMIDAQLALQNERAGTQRRTRNRRRARHQRKVPHALVEGFERLVIVYGESARSTESAGCTEFAHFVAHAVKSGEHFSCLINPRTGIPDDTHLQHMRLTRDDFVGSCTGDEFRARWQAFLGRSEAPLLAAWNQRTLELLATATDSPPGRVSLKAAYRAVHGTGAQSLPDVVEQQQLPVRELGLGGRASTRLAYALAVAEFIHDAAQPESAASAAGDS